MENYTREVLRNPGELVTDGKFNFGTYRECFERVNPLDVEMPFGRKTNRLYNNKRLKEWQAFQIGNEEYFVLLCIYDAKFLATAHFAIYNRKNGKRCLYEKLVSSRRISIPNSLDDTIGSYVGDNLKITIHNMIKENRIIVDAEAHGIKDKPDSCLHMEGHADVNEGMCVCLPFGENRAMYSYKNLMKSVGVLKMGEASSAFTLENSFMIMDDHKGFYPYRMMYDWATGVGRNLNGRLEGFNLTRNQVIDQDKFNENCLWINGKMQVLPPVTFERKSGVMGEWNIKDNFGRVDVTFTPQCSCPMNIRGGIIDVKYNGPYGSFRGHIVDDQGNKVIVDDFFGMGEKKYVRM